MSESLKNESAGVYRFVPGKDIRASILDFCSLEDQLKKDGHSLSSRMTALTPAFDQVFSEGETLETEDYVPGAVVRRWVDDVKLLEEQTKPMHGIADDKDSWALRFHNFEPQSEQGKVFWDLFQMMMIIGYARRTAAEIVLGQMFRWGHLPTRLEEMPAECFPPFTEKKS